MKNTLPNSVKRREFLAQASLAFGSFLIVPRHVLGGKRPDGSLYLAPSDVMNLGFIGTGKQGKGLSNSFMSTGEVRITAISEVYQAKAKQFTDRVRIFMRKHLLWEIILKYLFIRILENY